MASNKESLEPPGSSYREIKTNLETLEPEVLNVLSRAEYEKRFQVDLTSNARRHFSNLQTTMRREGKRAVAQNATRPYRVGQILHSVYLDGMEAGLVKSLKSELPVLAEAIMRNLMMPNPPATKVVEVIEDDKHYLELRVKAMTPLPGGRKLKLKLKGRGQPQEADKW